MGVSSVLGFLITLVENIAVVLILPTLKNFALGVMLAVSTIFTIINPANAAANDMTYYSVPKTAHQEISKESELINNSKNGNLKNNDQQKYSRSKYNSVKQRIEMNRTLKTGNDRRVGSGSYSS
ncbi:hypothetical protein ACS8FD_19950 [Psychrobacter sp. 1U2]|uniref:hypothetical protein n=1 Tax=Psychrobacter sp. 1U2 TaxID=3453577 RepID=UPI003F484F4D